MTADKFYNDPLYFRKLAYKAEYKSNISTEQYVTQEAIDKFSSMACKRVTVLQGSGHFHLTFANSELLPITAVPLADWVGVVYLNLPSQANGDRAVSFFTHKKTGLEAIPTEAEAISGGWNSLEEVLEGFVNIDGLTSECWTNWFTVYQRYNRVALWDAKLWYQEQKGFGDTINNCRLTQLFYLGIG